MRRPVALFVGLRYLQASKGNGFISFVNAASVAGVALGVAALIVVMSVMNGFENELRGRLLGFTAHASVVADEPFANWREVADGLVSQPGILGAAPYIELEGLLSGPAGITPAVLTGIEPARESAVSAVDDNMVLGTLDELTPGSRQLVLGRALAQQLGVSTGDRIALLVPSATQGRLGSSLHNFNVSGVFELGVQDHDSVRALLNLEDAAAITGYGERISGLRLETGDIFTAPAATRAALAAVAAERGLRVRDWTQENASYFRAIRLEKIMMALLLSLIIGVAAFNIVAMLVMIVTEKRGGIAILRTLGCSAGEIVAVFLLQGTLLGWFGALLGVGLGVWLSLNVDSLAPALESLFGFRFMPADLYYLTSLTSDLQTSDVLAAGLGVLALTALATVYPALRAARVEPAEVLRYE